MGREWAAAMRLPLQQDELVTARIEESRGRDAAGAVAWRRLDDCRRGEP